MKSFLKKTLLPLAGGLAALAVVGAFLVLGPINLAEGENERRAGTVTVDLGEQEQRTGCHWLTVRGIVSFEEEMYHHYTAVAGLKALPRLNNEVAFPATVTYQPAERWGYDQRETTVVFQEWEDYKFAEQREQNYLWDGVWLDYTLPLPKYHAWQELPFIGRPAFGVYPLKYGTDWRYTPMGPIVTVGGYSDFSWAELAPGQCYHAAKEEE